MGKKKPRKNLFETDLRKQTSPVTPMAPLQQFSDADHEQISLLPAGSKPIFVRVESYRAPPLQLTLETIEEDDSPKPSVIYLRSKSLPASHRKFSNIRCDQGLQRFPSYRPGQGVFGVSMSGPILPSTYDYDMSPKLRRSRFSTRISRMRDALRSNRVRLAWTSMFSRLKPTSRTSR